MNTRIFIIILAVSFGLMIFGAVIGGILESSGTVTRETLSYKSSITIWFLDLYGHWIMYCCACSYKDLLYLIQQISTQESDYESFGAEAFYVSKVSFQPGAE